MRIHILGICGTFMGSLALLARQQGHSVTGSDENIYPPMSDQLAQAGITLMSGYQPQHLQPAPDCVIIGNALSRGNAAVEYVLNNHLRYQSGPQWLAENILTDKWVLAVTGTHGKTTTSSMLAWILEAAGLNPGFLIGGVPLNFHVSARLTDSTYFVIEGDEYDTAFFDKRSKFLHYRPQTLIINNLEYDHADIFTDLAAIKQQFSYLLRTVPGTGRVLVASDDANVMDIIKQNVWSEVETFSLKNAELLLPRELAGDGNTNRNQYAAPWSGDIDWHVSSISPTHNQFVVNQGNKQVGKVSWLLCGEHNIHNALAAIVAAHHVGVEPGVACDALATFQHVKRRLQTVASVAGVTIYDDFAHHPTAIAKTIAGLRARVGAQRIIAILELGSFTMKSGKHGLQALADSLALADQVFVKNDPHVNWDVGKLRDMVNKPLQISTDVMEVVTQVAATAGSGDHILVMSNKGFEGIHGKLAAGLRQRGTV